MFTWICPKCGSEVPPSENECPNCRAKAATAVAQDPQVSAAETVPPQVVPPPRRTHAVEAPPRKAVSPTVVALGSALGMVALLAILYMYVLPRGSAKSTAATSVETPGAPVSSTTAPHPLAKYIEIAGLRIMEDKKGQAKIGYVLVNHSPADLPDLAAQITLTAAGKEMFTFPVSIPSIGPYESKDMSTSVKTQLQPYELPDWQALKPTLTIKSAP